MSRVTMAGSITLSLERLQQLYDTLKPVARQVMADGNCTVEERTLIESKGVDFFLTDQDLQTYKDKYKAEVAEHPLGFIHYGRWYGDFSTLKRVYEKAVELDRKDGEFDGNIRRFPEGSSIEIQLDAAQKPEKPEWNDANARSVFTLKVRMASWETEGTAWIIEREKIDDKKYRYWCVTCAHVADAVGGQENGYFLERKGRPEIELKLKGVDHTYDVGVLYFDSEEDFNPLRAADREEVAVNDTVYIIGNQSGAGVVTTRGTVNSARKFGAFSMPLIQDDSSSAKGNSGSPVFSERGIVVSVCNSGTDGVENFSIPMEYVWDSYGKIRKTGKAQHGMLWGYSAMHWEKRVLEKAGITSCDNALLVNRVIRDSAAQRAGLIVGDVIVEYDGRLVPRGDESNEMNAYIAGKDGGVVEFTILREVRAKTDGGTPSRTKLKIKVPVEPVSFGKMPTVRTPFGFYVAEADGDRMMKEFNIPRPGLIVYQEKFTSSSASGGATYVPIGVLHTIDDIEVRTIARLTDYLRSSRGKDFLFAFLTGDDPASQTLVTKVYANPLAHDQE